MRANNLTSSILWVLAGGPARVWRSKVACAAGIASYGLLLAAGPGAAANLGEQALVSQQQDNAPAEAPEQAEFNSSFLSGQARGVDLSVFGRGNPVTAGIYRADIYVNGSWQGRRDLDFKSDRAGGASTCMTLQMLEEFGVDTNEVLGGEPADTTACKPVQDWIPDAYALFNSSDLRYDLSVPQAFLRRSARGYVNPALWDRGINAGFVAYSLNAIDSQSRAAGVGTRRHHSGYLGLNAGVNLDGWQFRHDSNLTWNEGDGHHWQNIATYAQRGIAQVRGLLTLGDAYTSGELFDSIGYRGISLVSDDRMLPDSLRGYAPVVRGIAETNAQVEVRQNRQLIYSATVSPGSFVIDDLYPTGYGGDLEVTVVEADGRRRQFSVPYGSVAQMLRPGISRYAFTVGQVRNDYLDDEPYLLQVTYQRGVGNQLTLYGGSALSAGYASLLYGAGVSTGIGAFAVDVTHARTDLRSAGNRQGASVRLSYSNLIGETGTNLTLAAYRYSTDGFFSLQDAVYARNDERRGLDPYARGRQRSQLQLTLNQPLGQRWGALYVTGSVRDYYDRAGTSKQYQVGYNNAWRALNYGFSAIRTEEGIGRADTEYMLSLSMPLGRRRPLSVSSDIGYRHGYDSSRLGVTGAAGKDNNFTYSATLSDSKNGDTTAIANAEYRSRYSSVNGSYSYSDSYRQATVGANGSIVVHPGGITLAPQRGDTMVLVQAPAARDASVTNVPGLRIDGRGYAVVPYVSPYRMNTVTLDPQDMSRDVELESSSLSIAPYAGAIGYLKFGTRQGRALLIAVKNASGGPLPFGAQVEDAQGQPVGMVGQGGRLYVRSDHDTGQLLVRWGEDADQQCRIDYQVPVGAQVGSSGFIQVEASCR
ncbi:fimbria/pilus outer membrane usher protein [[Pseudomonas] boreopolis]|uniref:Outer membrane usher protein n=1 Tax=Xanthomonas boreopolis TaxID=86183 RepID=A0A919FC35_9XANT|nr:outer membrane usher protein [[Pseudomonas] boreopolis]